MLIPSFLHAVGLMKGYVTDSLLFFQRIKNNPKGQSSAIKTVPTSLLTGFIIMARHAKF